MGTKVEYSINLLATSVDSNNLTVGGVDVWQHYYQNKVLTNNRRRTASNYKLQDPMDRILDRNNIEHIKKTMQMHEEIFKHQVRELHRVYSVQKMLTDELKKEIRQQKLWNHPMNGIDVSHPHHFIQQQNQIAQTPYGFDFNVQSFREDPGSSREMTSGSCSGDTMRMQRGFDLERPAHQEGIFIGERGFDEGEAGPSTYAAFKNCKISTEEEMEVDLTLSIGGSSQVKKSHHVPHHQLAFSDSTNEKTTREVNNSSISLRFDRVEEECNDPTTPMSSSSVTFTQERKGPHWLSQGLKLK